MFIESNLIKWNGDENNFPLHDYIMFLKSKNFSVTSFGEIKKDTCSPRIDDLYILFQKDDIKYSVQFNKTTGDFILFKNYTKQTGSGFDDFSKKLFSSRQPIKSFTIKELLDNRDGQFIHHDKYTAELDSPVLEYCYANTLKFKIKSSQFGKSAKDKHGNKGVNHTFYNVYVLFQDFYTIGKDKDIPFADAIDYAIDFGDVSIRCNCPAFLYWGMAYIGTELRYIYGIPRESRYPQIRNPNLRGTICKHCDAVLQYIKRNRNLIVKMFAEYYNRLNEGQSIYAVNTNGTTITIGHKNENGDVFFEQQQEEEEKMKDLFDEDEVIDEKTSESEDDNNLADGEADVYGDPDWHIEDPTEGAVWDEEEEE